MIELAKLTVYRATEDEVVGWHHWFYGHEPGKLWKMLRDREAWCATAHGITQSWVWLSDWTTIPKWKGQPNFLQPWQYCIKLYIWYFDRYNMMFYSIELISHVYNYQHFISLLNSFHITFRYFLLCWSFDSLILFLKVLYILRKLSLCNMCYIFK